MKKTISLFARVALASLCPCFICGCGMGQRVQIAGQLLEIRDNEALKNAAMVQETRDFEQAKRFFLETKKADHVMSRDDCRRLFGEPASEFSGGWGYKPETSTWLKGERILLYFDDKGLLSRWEYLPS